MQNKISDCLLIGHCLCVPFFSFCNFLGCYLLSFTHLISDRGQQGLTAPYRKISGMSGIVTRQMEQESHLKGGRMGMDMGVGMEMRMGMEIGMGMA